MIKILKRLFSSGYVCQCCGEPIPTRFHTLCYKCEREFYNKTKQNGVIK